MKTKTKTVKKHFENAKEVKCLADGKVFNILNPNRNIHIYDDDFWLTTKDGKDVKLTRGDVFAEIISYKDTYTVSKDFILEAHESACSTWKTKIENQFPELFPKAELELNKRYWDIRKTTLVFFDNKNNSDFYGFSNGNWGFWSFSKGSNQDNAILATKEEVETALIAEAKKRGFKGKNYIKWYFDNVSFAISRPDLSSFNFENNTLFFAGGIVYKDGKWAEIISEPIEISLEEIAEKFGVDVSLIKIKK